jgi:calcineurin-like phosphoesterase family protein
MTTFFTAETHFNDPEVIKYEHQGQRIRPWDTVEEQNQFIIDNWNSRVKDTDTVYHMGDVYDVDIKDSSQLVGQLNGNKILIRGDKDTDPIEQYKQYFSEVYNPPHVVEINEVKYVLSHFYLKKDQLDELDCSVNIHSHLHADCVPNPRYFSVSLERTNFYPITSDELILEIKKHQIKHIKNIQF